MAIGTLLARFPIIEVILRHLYWRVPLLASKLRGIRRRPSPAQPALQGILDEFKTMVLQLGIGAGDVVIVHAETSRFWRSGHSVKDIIYCLQDIVGPAGTIAMPAIPLLKDEPRPEDRFDDSLFAKPFTYRKGKDRIWTGILPLALSRQPGAHLSSIPLNTMVAVGPEAQHIVEAQEFDARMTACGPASPWAKCYALDAKILMIDVDVAHSLTMTHTVEDLFEEEWPIKNWYRPRSFRVIDGGASIDLEMRERRPEWALFYCEKRFNRDLREQKVFHYGETPSGLSLAVGTSRRLVDFLRGKRPSTYPYFIPRMIGKRKA
jgi:aminoglycoside N3'-acetyltransferase